MCMCAGLSSLSVLVVVVHPSHHQRPHPSSSRVLASRSLSVSQSSCVSGR